MTRFYTIGVLGKTEGEFFASLKKSGVDVLIDIRRRRAVRGRSHAFSNSVALQSKLKRMGIRYMHVLDLAPTNDMRHLQTQDDAKHHVTNVKRDHLGSAFAREYTAKVLKPFDFRAFFARVSETGTTAVLLCVEAGPKACHRSLVADELRRRGARVSDII